MYGSLKLEIEKRINEWYSGEKAKEKSLPKKFTKWLTWGLFVHAYVKKEPLRKQ